MVISCLSPGALRELRAASPCDLGARRLRLHAWMSTGERVPDQPGVANLLRP